MSSAEFMYLTLRGTSSFSRHWPTTCSIIFLCGPSLSDDQPDVVEALRLLLKQEGYQIETANSPAGPCWTIFPREISICC